MSKSPAPPSAVPANVAPPNEITLPTAGVFRRLAALVYDAFLLFGLLVVPLFILIAVTSPRRDMPQGSVAHELPSIAPQPVLLIYMVAVVGGFYCYFWRKSGQTLGMQAWRMRVDTDNGARPSWRQCGIRGVVGFLSVLCAGCGFWWAWLDKNRATWHDRASNTRVVVLPKRKS